LESFLERILEQKHREVAALSQPKLRRELEGRLGSAPPVRDFRRALADGSVFRIIAEMKKASPSRGLLAPDYDPGRIARLYRDGGACALSVLTDKIFFQGSPHHLREAREAVSLPVLRKDFLVDPLQVEEARGLGADAVLLIAAALTPALLQALLQLSRKLGMSALVEVHDAEDLEKALGSGADLVGVNNRDLRTLQVDRSVSLALAPLFPTDVLRVSESGITRRYDLEILTEAGYSAFLVGETLMTEEDPLKLLHEWTK